MIVSAAVCMCVSVFICLFVCLFVYKKRTQSENTVRFCIRFKKKHKNCHVFENLNDVSAGHFTKNSRKNDRRLIITNFKP